MTEPWQQLARPLPVPTGPVHGELISSYVRRLAEANGLSPRILVKHLGCGSIPTTQSESDLRQSVRAKLSEDTSILRMLADVHSPAADNLRQQAMRRLAEIRQRAQHAAPFDAAFDEQDLILNQTALDRLSLVSGYPPTILRRTLTTSNVDPPPGNDPAWRFRRLGLRDSTHPACTRCAAARGITDRVIVRLGAHEIVCLRHQRWLADPPHNIYPYLVHDRAVSRLNRQLDLTRIPEIIVAARRHQRLVRRYGEHHVGAAFRSAHEVITAVHELESEDLASRWRRRGQRLDPEVTDPTRIHLTRYPDIVTVLPLLLTPVWRRAARRTTPDDTDAALRCPEHWDNDGPQRPHHHDFEAELWRRLDVTSTPHYFQSITNLTSCAQGTGRPSESSVALGSRRSTQWA